MTVQSKILKYIPDWLRVEYNRRYYRMQSLHTKIPKWGSERIAEFLRARSLDKKPSVLSKLAAVYLIDYRPEDEALTLSMARQFSKKSSSYMQYRMGDRMLRGRLYIKDTAGFLKRAIDRNHEVYATFRYLDYLTQVRGYGHPEVARVADRFRRGHFRRSMTRSQKVKASVTLLRIGKKAFAKDIYLTIPQSSVRQGQLPVFLQRNAYKHQWRNWEYQRRGSEEYTLISSGRDAFCDFINEHRHSFCVVGNGPSEMGKSKGPLIDSHDVVIRINSYDLSHPEDYGRKQSVWVRVPNEEAHGDHIVHNSFLIIAANQFEYKRGDADKYLLPGYILNKPMASIPPAVFRELMAELNCLPSTGLALLYWIYKICGPIQKDSLFGFSHLDEIMDFRSHYFADKVERRLHVHAWEKEMAIMARITK